MKIFTTPLNLKFLCLAMVFMLCGTLAANAQNNTTGGCSVTTTWNGTAWSNGEPNTGVRAVITGNFTSSANIFACNLTVNNGAHVTISAGTTLTVNNEISVNSNSLLVIQNNANLVQINDSAVNNGTITVLRNSSSLYRLDYTLWSSPVSGQQLQSFSPATSSNRFYNYTYSTDNSGNVSEMYSSVNAAANFETGKSYLIRMPNADNASGYNNGTTALTFQGSFTGVPTNGTVTKTLATLGNRYTAVGNPYASAINVQDFFAANSEVLDPAAGLYFWRKKNDTNAGSYATLTRDAYVYNHANGQEQFGGEQWDELFNEASSQNWVINPGQGFLVKTAEGVANPQLVFNNAMRRGDVHNNQFFRTAEDDQKSRVWLNLTGNDAFSQTAIVYSNTATTGLDYGRDGKLITSGTVAFYSIADATDLTIQARPAFQNNDVVVMGYMANTAGNYTVSMHRKDGIFTEGQNIYIKDNVTGAIHNLNNDDYSFTTAAGTFNDRFTVVYTTEVLGNNTPAITNNDVIVYKQNAAINISAGTNQITDVAVYDISGRKLYGSSSVNASQTVINGLQVAQEMLIVEINTVKGKVSKKILF
ncbi:hypothetical protein Q765_19145 [Flavobacterium rivuli WB 3.3-2 = DSM 21788]|uniref:T9SS sorting signal type C domain-containing protein n=1 Tax=Flavobacterium rivuli WB 3.3-2 = DSM 21788 TaxID=1121895 RepID=A0A0A2M9A5_9FLAO|nr:T9SS sorting signal type C domain-containing protein [Flavobacterium rivuli]KGO84885.1 hypothetical protein Q765_19145 [Flavobacterium rivuli WB 3.3-2 = DSM 21788]